MMYYNIESMQNNRTKPRSQHHYNYNQYQSPKSQQYLEQDPHNITQNDPFSDEEEHSQAEPVFQTQNYFFQLKSKCNQLEYQKAKISLSHQTSISQIRQKYAYLQNLAGELSQQNQQLNEEKDNMRQMLAEIREENHQLSKQINSLKMELRRLYQTNYEHQHSYEVEGSADLLEEIKKKDQMLAESKQSIQKLQGEISYLKSQDWLPIKTDENQSFKNTITKLERERTELIKQLQIANQKIAVMNTSNAEISKTVSQQQDLLSLLAAKERQLTEVKVQKQQLVQQLQETVKDYQQRERKSYLQHGDELKRLSDILQNKEQFLKTNQNERVQLEGRLNQLGIEVSRLKCQKNGLQQYNKYLEGCNSESQLKRKSIQQELYKNQKNMEQLRSQLFNQKLQNKKLINSVKMEFEEEKIKHLEVVQEKYKQINKLKELSLSSNRNNIDLEEINQQHQTVQHQLEKYKKMNQVLKTQNQTLKADYKNIQVKYERKSQKYNTLEINLRAQYQKRIKSLQSQIIKQSQGNVKKSTSPKTESAKTNKFIFPVDNEDDKESLIQMNELLKIQIKEKKLKIKSINAELNIQAETISQQTIKIKKLQEQLNRIQETNYRGSYNQEEVEDKIKTIDQLEQEIARLNDQLRKNRSVNEQRLRQLLIKLENGDKEINKAKEEQERSSRDLQSRNGRVNQLERQIIRKETVLQIKDGQLNKIEQQCNHFQQQNIVLKDKITELQTKTNSIQNNQNQMISRKDKQIQQLKNDKNQTEANLASIKNQKNLSIKPQQIKNNNDQQQSKSQQIRSSNQNVRIEQLQKQNYHLKYDYSQSLQQINTLLFKYQSLQQKYKKQQVHNQKYRTNHYEKQDWKNKYEQLKHQHRQDKQKITACQQQIFQLNAVLMEKQTTMRQYHRPTLSPSHHPKPSPLHHPKLPLGWNDYRRQTQQPRTNTKYHPQDNAYQSTSSYQIARRKSGVGLQQKSNNYYPYKL